METTNYKDQILNQFYNAPDDESDPLNEDYFKALEIIENGVINYDNLPEVYDMIGEYDGLNDLQKTCLYYAIKIKILDNGSDE